MPRRWLRNTATKVLTGTVTENDAAVAPSGHDYVAESSIRALFATGPISPGGTFTATGYTQRPGATGAALIAERRKGLALRIRQWMRTPSLAIVTARGPDRGTGFARKLEADTRAILIDTNMSTRARYNVISAELALDPERWIWKFEGTTWYNPAGAGGGYYGPQITGQMGVTWRYRRSADIDADNTADNVGGAVNGNIVMLQTDLDWVSRIAQLAG